MGNILIIHLTLPSCMTQALVYPVSPVAGGTQQSAGRGGTVVITMFYHIEKGLVWGIIASVIVFIYAMSRIEIQ